MSDGPVKVCNGPAHVGPTRIPLDEDHWHFYRSGPRAGRALARCKLCRHWRVLVTREGPHGLVDAKKLRPYARELVDRCGGFYKVERAHGVGAETLRGIVEGRTVLTRKRTVEQVLRGLSEQRKYDRRNGTSARFMEARLTQARIEERVERDGCG